METEDSETTSSGNKAASSASPARTGTGGGDEALFEAIFDAFIVQLSTSSAEVDQTIRRI